MAVVFSAFNKIDCTYIDTYIRVDRSISNLGKKTVKIENLRLLFSQHTIIFDPQKLGVHCATMYILTVHANAANVIIKILVKRRRHNNQYTHML